MKRSLNFYVTACSLITVGMVNSGSAQVAAPGTDAEQVTPKVLVKEFLPLLFDLLHVGGVPHDDGGLGELVQLFKISFGDLRKGQRFMSIMYMEG